MYRARQTSGTDISTNEIGGCEQAHGFNTRLAGDQDFTATVLKLVPIIFPLGRTFALGVLPAASRHGEFAEVPDGDAVLDGVVPDKTCRSVCERVIFVLAHAVGITARPTSE